MEIISKPTKQINIKFMYVSTVPLRFLILLCIVRTESNCDKKNYGVTELLLITNNHMVTTRGASLLPFI